jgi:molecular chaperone GrpE
MKNKTPSSASNDDASEAEVTLEPGLEPWQMELAAEKERYLRLAADFDNFRKRTARDSEQHANARKEMLMRELLPIVDNFERALASNTPASDPQVRRGLEMILQQLSDLLKRQGVEPENALGQSFDPKKHEALNARFDPAQPDHTVVEVVQRGYRRGDSVFRPAQVIINDHNLAARDHHGR